MNSNFPDLLINGSLICLYLQLILLGIFNIFNKTVRNVILGTICCLLALSFIYTIYWSLFNKSLFFNILLGGYKHMFLPSLIYLYLALLPKNNHPKRLITNNLILPLIIHISYIIMKFGFKDFYSQNIVDVVGFINSFIFLSYVFYLIKGIVLLKKLKPIILVKIHKRYSVFFYVLFSYGIFLVSTSLIPYFTNDEDYYKTFMFLSQDIYITLAVIVNLGVLVFAILESPKIKTLLYGNKIYTGYDSISNEENIRTFIKEVFKEKKLFKDVDFDIKANLKAYKVDDNEFKLFIKKEYNQTPIEFINSYRVEEFKTVVQLDENSKYSLIGIANKVGFKSKATFYRNFKTIEGITPKQYCNNLEIQE